MLNLMATRHFKTLKMEKQYIFLSVVTYIEVKQIIEQKKKRRAEI